MVKTKKMMLAIIMVAAAMFVFSAPARAEPYVSGYLGAAFPHDSNIDDNSGLGILYGDMEFDNGWALGAKGGYWFEEQNLPSLGLELDLNAHFPKASKINASGVGLSTGADVTVWSYTVNFLLRYPEGNFRPYGGVGGGWFFGKVDDGTIVGVPFNGGSDSAYGWQVLAGLDYLINPNVSVFVEYKYSRADFEFGGDLMFEVTYAVSQVYAGISYNFR